MPADPSPPPEPSGTRILVVEDDASYGVLLRYQLEREGYRPEVVGSGEEGLQRLPEVQPAVVLLDVMLPGKDGRQVLAEIHRDRPDLPVVMITAAGSVEMAVECMKRGAYDFLTKPFEFERLYAILRNAVRFRELKKQVKHLEGTLVQRHGFDQIIAHAPAMKEVLEQARRAAQTDSDILILGDSGTGKEVVARAIHFNSARGKGPFVAINCGAIPDSLLESELFGHEKGAFTGAVARRAGCFEQAHGGTLFLDEIAEMRPEMQVRLLRALEEREVRRVGGDKTIRVNVRVISATNQNLDANVRSKKFRTDLYYRLAILVLKLPLLKERLEDIGPLARFFLNEARREGHTHAQLVAPETLDVLIQYPWPGNVRELRNAIERAVVFEDSGQLTINSLPPDLIRHTLGQHAVPPPKLTETYHAQTFREMLKERREAAAPGDGETPETPAAPAADAAPPAASTSAAGLPEGAIAVSAQATPTPTPPSSSSPDGRSNEDILTMEEEEKRIILRVLSITGGNISEAARRLGLHRSTLHRKMARYGLATDSGLPLSGAAQR